MGPPPEAGALLAALTDPDRNFDAIVVGSSERAFYGNQFTVMSPLFENYGVIAWIPELGGAADSHSLGDEELMVLLGILAKREVARARIRAHTAMTVQARDQGRYLGGRPPYGYRLIDAGPHSNRALARRGVRIHRLDPDPCTGPIVTWIFHQRLAGRSTARSSPQRTSLNRCCKDHELVFGLGVAALPGRQGRSVSAWNSVSPLRRKRSSSGSRSSWMRACNRWRRTSSRSWARTLGSSSKGSRRRDGSSSAGLQAG
ncbi:hypothetical protein [Streptomyces sp. NPDC002573]|uniref:hypothetical protein n=1 Tax=Streptomyces sp. NPDC002573 TaxID=3364651 RepID=UPI00367E4E63